MSDIRAVTPLLLVVVSCSGEGRDKSHELPISMDCIYNHVTLKLYHSISLITIMKRF